MDFRPIDTTATITTRNLIRIGAITQLCLVLIYLSIEPYFSGAHMSWIHQLHVLLQPLVIFVSVSDSSVITMATLFIAMAAALFDGVVTWLNYVSISRCLNEPSATCFELVWEKGIWLLLGVFVLSNDILLILRILTLQKVLSKKDTHEKASKNKYESLSIKPAPVLKTLEVHNAKLRIIHTFLIPAGVVYTFLMLERAFEPIYWVTVGHLLLDLYGIGVSKIHDRTSLIITLALTILFAGANVFGLVVRMSTPNETIADDLSYLIAVLYLFSDSLIVFFSVSNLNLLSKYDKLKKN